MAGEIGITSANGVGTDAALHFYRGAGKVDAGGNPYDAGTLKWTIAQDDTDDKMYISNPTVGNAVQIDQSGNLTTKIGGDTTWETHTNTADASGTTTCNYDAQGSINLGAFIMKWGRIEGDTSNALESSESVTFTSAFPNQCSNLQCTFDVIAQSFAGGGTTSVVISALSRTAFTLSTYASYEGVYWMAIGY